MRTIDLNESMNKVELLFLNMGIKREGIIMYSKDDALQFIDECKKQHVVILGIDGFYLTHTTVQPSMENSVDFSNEPFDEALYQDAIRFLEKRDPNLHFEIVCGE